MFTSNSSQLFAGSHVLLRHIVPRHSPNALYFLVFCVCNVFLSCSCFFLSTFFSIRKNFPYPVFKDLFSFFLFESFFHLSKPDRLFFSSFLAQVLFFVYFLLLLRKEVIHPHVPVGIPCYDLTPIISSTLGISLLCRLG